MWRLFAEAEKQNSKFGPIVARFRFFAALFLTMLPPAVHFT